MLTKLLDYVWNTEMAEPGQKDKKLRQGDTVIQKRRRRAEDQGRKSSGEGKKYRNKRGEDNRFIGKKIRGSQEMDRRKAEGERERKVEKLVITFTEQTLRLSRICDH